MPMKRTSYKDCLNSFCIVSIDSINSFIKPKGIPMVLGYNDYWYDDVSSEIKPGYILNDHFTAIKCFKIDSVQN